MVKGGESTENAGLAAAKAVKLKRRDPARAAGLAAGDAVVARGGRLKMQLKRP